MAFFEELGKKAQAVAGVAAEKAKDLAGVASEKAKSVSDSAKASMEIISEQREMEKNYRAIGELEAAKAAKKEGESCPCSCQEQPAGEETQQKVCPVCGESSDGKFCPKCGAPMGE